MKEFLAQGGYAFYIWGAYGMTALLLAIEVVVLARRRRTILARLGRLVRMRGNKAS
ncbi:heme exporter protein CcmD [Thioflavicoccus mobilis 8321]|uniref:Heme exporter protein D n=1 Tax=Thioflavicoccus mobilis 8321 TaxID=765912 RepID=L0GXX1_9GAMM|nr:heme exporter protein CcmD [Thioflavicoccus mobilis]AGA90149.1 heme exporter protein CcmD [Thioflavicoccus mobilis 8321]